MNTKGEERANEPAYPVEHGAMPCARQGLTIREHFAGLAMQGLLANPAMVNQNTSDEHIGRSAAYFADALIAALTQGEVK